MKLSESGELSLIERVRQGFTGKKNGIVRGIGDDSAVVKAGRVNVLLTTDMMVEGVHFDLAWTTPFQLGFKLVSVNVSDIYAMGGRPEYILINFAAPGDAGVAFFDQVFEGIKTASERYHISLVGGDMSSSDRIILSATVTGRASRVLLRSGARVGDFIYVTGFLGDSACGLKLLETAGRPVEIEKGRKSNFGIEWKTVLPLLKRHLLPAAVRPGRFARRATSMIDVSDGLLIDLSRVCRESGVGARLFEDRIPLSRGLRKCAEHLHLSPLDLALAGGEDYELLFTSPDLKRTDAFCIGEVIGRGMKIVDGSGKVRNVSAKGYQHFVVKG